MSDYETISDEELWGVPPEDLPPADTGRNYFDEQQAIKKLSDGECGCFILTD